MEAIDHAERLLDLMLGHLGVVARIEREEHSEGPSLHIFTADSARLIGVEGDRLDDLQYLLNRMLQEKRGTSPKIRLDCEHFKATQEERLLEEVRDAIAGLKISGQERKLRPLNSYYRRLVYQELEKEPDVVASSPKIQSRYKRITLKLKTTTQQK